MEDILVIKQKTIIKLKISKKKVKNKNNKKLKSQKQNKNESTLSEEEMKYIYKFIKKKVLKNENQIDYQITIFLEVIPGARKSFAYEIDRKKCLDLVPIRVIRPYYKEAKIKSNYDKKKQLKVYLKNKNELLLSEEEFLRAYINIYQTVLKNKLPVDSPIAITLGGQPGSGKSTIYKIARERFSNNIVEIDVDKFRIFHPYYKQIKKFYGKYDAIYTNPFIFKVRDLLIEQLSSEKYNLIIESSLKTPNSALTNGKKLPPKGYKVELQIMATPKKISWQGTIDRYNKELKRKGHPRAVPKEFHDRVVSNICKSLEDVIKSELMSNIIIYNRNKICLYNMKKDNDKNNPCELLNEIINM